MYLQARWCFTSLLLGLSHALLAPVVMAQQNTSVPNGAATSAPGGSTQPQVAAPKPGIFYEKDLDIHFNYPVEMVPLDGNAEMESGHMNLYGVPGDADPEHRQARRCVRFLLDAELPKDKSPNRNADLNGIWTDGSKEAKQSSGTQPIFAKILVLELLRDCLPEKLRKDKDAALGSIALSFVSEPGIQRMPQPWWYETAGQKIHMNSGAGRPIVNGQTVPVPIIIMSMATEWRGHLLAWVFTSNDAETFNETTKSVVQFGNEPWGAMFAPNIGPKGSGTPITVLTK